MVEAGTEDLTAADAEIEDGDVMDVVPLPVVSIMGI